jgi:PAS domain S-box-containing protein
MSDVKTAEMQELDQSVEEKVLENMKDGVIWTADHGTIVYMNSSARNILGLEDTEIIGKKFAGVFIDRKENDGFVESVIGSRLYNGIRQCHASAGLQYLHAAR